MKKAKQDTLPNHDPLKRLGEHLQTLQSGNLNVEAENPNIVRCWERLGCSRTDCPAYGKLRCWSIAGTFCHDAITGEQAKKLGDCKKCVVYRESCRDNYSELLEIFNQTVKDLKHSFQQANRESARAERVSALEEMAATVAHETRNPLHAIGLATAYLRNNYHDRVITEFLGVIEEELKRLNEIIDSFIAFSAPAPFAAAPHDLAALATGTIGEMQPKAADHRLRLQLQSQPDMPELDCDGTKIRELLRHLLDNAIEASAPGGNIAVDIGREGPQAIIQVTDQGAGISKDNLPHVLKPFFTTKTRGPGLGLALVDQIVRAHWGTIQIESISGEGTQVTVRLPFRRPVD